MAVIAGLGRANITPPVGIMQSGYAARQTGSESVHDDLTATALYVAQEGVEAALVSLDVLMLPTDQVAPIRQCCETLTGVPAQNLMLACTHSHSGPVLGPGEGDALRAAYAEALRWLIAGAVREAKLQAAPVRLAHTQQPVRLAMNRRERTPDGTVLGRNPDGPQPSAADVVGLAAAEGDWLGTAVVYDCHGTTLGGDNLRLSAEYPGYARRFLETQLPGLRALVMGGCGADQNPDVRGSFAAVERNGQALGAAAFGGLLDLGETRPVAGLVVHTVEARLPLEPLPSLAECRAQLADLEAQAATERGDASDDSVLSWALARQLRQARERLAQAEAGATDLALTCEVQVLALDDVAFVALPGEIFFNLGQAIRAQSPFAATLPLGWSNGSIGYVPTQDEVPYGGYEVDMARANAHGLLLRDDGGAALVAAAVEALQAAHARLAQR